MPRYSEERARLGCRSLIHRRSCSPYSLIWSGGDWLWKDIGNLIAADRHHPDRHVSAFLGLPSCSHIARVARLCKPALPYPKNFAWCKTATCGDDGSRASPFQSPKPRRSPSRLDWRWPLSRFTRKGEPVSTSKLLIWSTSRLLTCGN